MKKRIKRQHLQIGIEMEIEIEICGEVEQQL